MILGSKMELKLQITPYFYQVEINGSCTNIHANFRETRTIVFGKTDRQA